MPKNFDSRGAYKRHKLDLMDDYLRSLGLKRKPLPKDGCCIFRAVSEQLFFSQNCHYSIRQACVRYMKKNRDVYESLTEVCFDEYLGRLTHSKEWADQLEMGALSKMYKSDFLIYMHPGQVAKNVTDNGFDKKVHLCHSGQQQYDSVYSFNYFSAHAMCQSIVFEILFERVLGFEKTEKTKLVNTYRMLSFPSATDKEGAAEKIPFHDQIPRNSILSPCIGTLSKDKPITEQVGLGYKLAISLDFIRGLDPFIFRNIDYDWWIIVKRKPQYIDFSISEGMHFYIGDRCRISLSPFSKPLLGHVQEISPSNGPITCFIEALGELLTIAAANATRLEPEHCKPLPYRSRRKFRDSEAFRQGASGGGGRRWLSRPPRSSDQDELHEGGGGGNGNDQSLANGVNNCNIGYENGHKGNNYHLRNGQPPPRKISEGHWSPHRKPNKFQQQQSEDYDVVGGSGRRRQTSKNWRNIPLQPGDNQQHEQQEYYSNDGGGEWWWGDKATAAAATYEQLPATGDDHDDGGHGSHKNHHPTGGDGSSRLYPTSRHQSDKHNRHYDVSGRVGRVQEVCWNMEGGDKENQINENSELQKSDDNQGVHTGNDHFTRQQNDGQQDTNFQQQDHHGGIHDNEEICADCSDQPPVVDETDQHAAAAAPYTVRAVGPNEWVSYVPAYGYAPQNYTVEGGGVEDGRVDGGGYYTTEDRTPYNYFYNLGVEYYRMIANNGNGGNSNGQGGNQLAPATPLVLAPAPINHHNNSAAAATGLYSTTPLVQPSTPHISFPSPTTLNCIPASNPPNGCMAPNQAATPHHATMPYVAASSQYHSPMHPTSGNIMQNQSVTRFYFPVSQQTPSIAVAAPLQYQSVIVQHPATDEDSSNDSTNVATAGGGNYMITAAEMNGNLQQYPSYQVEGGYPVAPHNTTILQHASNSEATTNYIAMAPTTYYHQPPQYYQATSDQATIPPMATSSTAPATCQ